MNVDQGIQQRSQDLACDEALCQALPMHTQQSLMANTTAGTWPKKLFTASLVAAL